MEDGKKKILTFGIIGFIIVALIVALIMINVGDKSDEAPKNQNNDQTEEGTDNEAGSDEDQETSDDEDETVNQFEAVVAALSCSDPDDTSVEGVKNCTIEEELYNLMPDTGTNLADTKTKFAPVCANSPDAAFLKGSGFFLYHNEKPATSLDDYKSVTDLLSEDITVELEAVC